MKNVDHKQKKLFGTLSEWLVGLSLNRNTSMQNTSFFKDMYKKLVKNKSKFNINQEEYEIENYSVIKKQMKNIEATINIIFGNQYNGKQTFTLKLGIIIGLLLTNIS